MCHQTFAIDRYIQEGIQEASKERGHQGMAAFLTNWERTWEVLENQESKLCYTVKPLIDN